MLEQKCSRIWKSKQQRMLERMYKHKRMLHSYKNKLPKIAEKIDELKQKQQFVAS
jgi:hypothetical protein